eukprot:522103_1
MSDLLQIFSDGLTILFFVGVIIFAIHTVTHYCNGNDDNATFNRTNENVVVLCILILCCLSICMALCISISFGSVIFKDSQHLIEIIFAARVLFQFSSTFIQLLFLHTMHITFRLSSYDYPSWIKLILFVCIWLVLIALVAFIYFIYFVDAQYQIYYVLVYVPSEYIINISLLILFNRNLILAAKDQFLHSDRISIQKSQSTQKFLNIIVRNTVLFAIFAIIGLLNVIFALLLSPLIKLNINEQTLNAIFWIMQISYCIGSGSCVYLKMNFTSKMYYMICKWPHFCCLKCVQSTAARLWVKQHNDLDKRIIHN